LFEYFGKADYYDKLNCETDFQVFCSYVMQKEKMLSRFLHAPVLEAERIFLQTEKDFFSKKENGLDLPKKMMLGELYTWLPNESLSRSDRMCMAFGLEQRVPILDKEIVELAFRIPTKYKIGNAKKGKVILKKAMKEYIPDFIYNKSKSGWFCPASSWLRTDMKDFVSDVLSESYNSGAAEFIDFKEVKVILNNHNTGKEYALHTIWSLVTFQLWYKQFMR